MSSNTEPMNATVAEPCCAHPGCENPIEMDDITFQTHHTVIETKTIHIYKNFTYSENDFINQMEEDEQVKWAALTHAQREEAWERLKEDFPFTLGTDRDCDTNHIDDWCEENDEEDEESQDGDFSEDWAVEKDIDNEVERQMKHLRENVFATPEEKQAKAIADLKAKIEALDESLFKRAELYKAEFMKKVATAREETEKDVAALRKQLADLTLATV